MPYKLRFSTSARETLSALEHGDANDLAKLRKALGFLEQDPRCPGLHSRQYESFPVDEDVKVWTTLAVVSADAGPLAARFGAFHGPPRQVRGSALDRYFRPPCGYGIRG